MKIKNEIKDYLDGKPITFKSSEKYFPDERDDKKNNTEREVDWEDIRFHILWLMKEMEEYGQIRIMCDYGVFTRNIKHICFWKNIVIVTWKPELKEEE